MKYILISFILTFASVFFSCKKEETKYDLSPHHAVNMSSTTAKPTSGNGILSLNISPVTWQITMLTQDGHVLWTKELLSLKNQFADISLHCFSPTKDGGCIIGAEFYLDTATYYRSAGLLLKLGAAGQQEWISVYDTFKVAGSRHLDDITIDPDDNIILVEKSNTATSSYNLLTFDRIGQLQVRSNLGLTSPCKKITAFKSGEYYILADNEYMPALVKTDGLGNIAWSTTLSEIQFYENKISSPCDFIMTSSGQILVSGFTNEWNGDDINNFDYFLMKLDSDGTIIDTITWKGYANEYNRTCTLTSDGSVYLTGTTCSAPANFTYGESLYNLTVLTRCYILKLDPSLHLSWKKTFGNSYGSEGLIVTERSDGNLLICGNQIAFGNKNEINIFSEIIKPNGE